MKTNDIMQGPNSSEWNSPFKANTDRNTFICDTILGNIDYQR